MQAWLDVIDIKRTTFQGTAVLLLCVEMLPEIFMETMGGKVHLVLM